MMWHLNFFLGWFATFGEWLLDASTLNHLFALVCLLAAMGASARAVALLTALLYLLLNHA
jgi:hypothetical protein